MYFKLNNFTGRLIGANNLQPYYPIGVAPLSKNDPPKVVFQDASVKPVKTTPARFSSSSAGGLYNALKKKQELFQKHDGIPVYIKGGPMDKALFGVTIALCVVGVIGGFHTLYIMSFPKRN